ncbi:hypothetical protein [Synechococcus lacustris]|uniref:hypothetical protein n=1 Tax=Synechococcus lacustris TaxID=2116544 RepID=UPI0020CCBE25|nr:hypothetical protein [Synechococcus lacustris]MCP9811623.1 hypothetical protein [Synechococcus lacustris Maggiore-St4-Slac]
MNSAQFAWFTYLFQAGFFKQPGALLMWQTILQSLATPSAASSIPPAQSSLFTPFFAYESGSTYPTSYALQGITGGNSSGDYIITGTKNLANGGNPAAQGLVYQGPINAANTSQGNGSGTWTIMNVPNGINTINNPTVNSYTNTSIYGVNNLGSGLVNLVGSVSPANVTYDSAGFPASTLGFYYEGPITTTPDKNNFQVFQPKFSDGSLANYTFIHSVDGGLAAGGYDSFPTRPDIHAFIYNPTASDSNKQKDIILPGSDNALTKTAYGIWHNQGSSYTIAGGVGLQYDASRKKISAINPRALAPPIYWITIPLQAYLATTKPLITHLQALQKRLKPISRVFGITATAHTNCQPQFHQGPMAALGLQLLQQSPEIT